MEVLRMIKTILKAAAVFLILFMIFENLKAEHIKYYRSYHINELDYSIVGKDSLTENEASKTMCNKFIYNDDGKLIRIEGFALGLNFKDTYEGVYKIRFEYKDDTTIKTFFNQNDDQMMNDKHGVYGVITKSLATGYQLNFIDENDKKVENQFLIFSIIYTRGAEKSITKKFYNKAGQIIKNNLEDVYQIQIFSNSKDYPIEIKYLDKNMKLMNNLKNYSFEKIKYDLKNNEIEKKFYNEHGKLTSTYPYKLAIQKKVNNRWQYFTVDNEPISIHGRGSIEENNFLDINYNLVMQLSTKDLLNNFFTVENAINVFDQKYNRLKTISLLKDYFPRQFSIIDSLKREKLILKNGYAFYNFHSTMPENGIFIKKALTLPPDSLRKKFKQLFTLADATSRELLENLADPAARGCYGLLTIDEILFFKWEDILFCVNPHAERHGGQLSKRKNIVIDFTKLPISDDINHVFFEAVTVENINPGTFYYKDINYYFNYCLLKFSDTKQPKLAPVPKSVFGGEVIFNNHSKYIFNDCPIDSLNLDLTSGYSMLPARFFLNYDYSFLNSKIDYCNIHSVKFTVNPYYKNVKHTVKFDGCQIDRMNISGTFSILAINSTKIKNFYGANVNTIENNFQLLNSSFESPLNFPNLVLSDSAKFEMINTSYQAYMKFPWQELKGKIHLTTEKDQLKIYGNLYNLLSSNYKLLSLIKDADESYFYWKQFEKRNFWKMYWKEPGTHWYNPLNLSKAIGLTIFNNVNYFSCGYGVRPLWIFPFTIFVVCFFAVIYFFLPTRISNLEDLLISKDKIAGKLRSMKLKEIKVHFKDDDFDFNISKQGLIEDIISSVGTDELMGKLNLKPQSKYTWDFFWYCFYFSFSTFTTIGIGDWYPAGKLNKALVMIEGAIGWLCLGLFITTYANILLR